MNEYLKTVFLTLFFHSASIWVVFVFICSKFILSTSSFHIFFIQVCQCIKKVRLSDLNFIVFLTFVLLITFKYGPTSS